jgi:hypothetical protein
MNEFEQNLQSSLRRYGQGFTPSDRRPLSSSVRGTTERGRRSMLASAMAIVLVVGSLLGVGALLVERNDPPASPAASSGSYQPVAGSPLSPRKFPDVYWSGKEFVVWGGLGERQALADGARLDPDLGRWTPIAQSGQVPVGAPTAFEGGRLYVVAASGGMAYELESETWSSLAEIPLASTSEVSNALAVDDSILAIAIEQRDGGDAIAEVWILESGGSTWRALEATTLNLGPPPALYELPSGAMRYQITKTADGFLVVSGGTEVWAFGLDSGWVKQGVVPQYADDGRLIRLIGIASSVDSTPIVVANLSDGTKDVVAYSELASAGLGPWEEASSGAFLNGRVVSAEETLVVLGPSTMSGVGAVTVTRFRSDDPLVFLPPWPLETVLDAGVGIAERRIMVWGGTLPTGDSTTTDKVQLSSAGALLEISR